MNNPVAGSLMERLHSVAAHAPDWCYQSACLCMSTLTLLDVMVQQESACLPAPQNGMGLAAQPSPRLAHVLVRLTTRRSVLEAITTSQARHGQDYLGCYVEIGMKGRCFRLPPPVRHAAIWPVA